MNDLRLALRGLQRSPLFAVVAVLSLALGIGANTAIYTLIDQILLRKLPVRAPDELVMLYQQGSHAGNNMGIRMHSYPIYQELQQRAEPLAEVLARRPVETSVTMDGQTERLAAEMVSGNYFSMLGVKAAVGRVFSSEEDDRVYQGHPVVVLSHEYWMRRFAGDPAVVGKKILVNNYPMTIVGVSAAGFAGLDPTRSPQIRVPILMKPVIVPEWEWVKMDDERSRWVQVFGRLKPGYTVKSAQGPLQGLFLQIREHEMTLPGAKDFTPYIREQFMKGTLTVAPAAMGYSPLRNDFSTPLVVLMCMVGLVLLIACANVANLLIARGFMRQREIAVRLSLGATRRQLVRQLLTESLLLAFAGGAMGLLLASGMTRTLLAYIPVEGAPLLVSPSPDAPHPGLHLHPHARHRGGLRPAAGAAREPARHVEHAQGHRGRRGRVGRVALPAQESRGRAGGAQLPAALRRRALRAEPAEPEGHRHGRGARQPRHLPVVAGAQRLRRRAHRHALRAAAGAPASRHPASCRRHGPTVPILSGDEWDSTMSVEGHQAKDGEDMQAFMNMLSPGYFTTMKIPLLEGRDFRLGDAAKESRVAIVNHRFAEHFFPGKSALGRHLGFGDRPGTKLEIEIVGVTADSLYEGPREGVRRQVFIPSWGKNGATFYARTQSASASAFTQIRGELRALDAGIPVYAQKTVAGQLDETLLTDRLIAMLSAGFGLLATVLASVGLYGVMAFVVARRRKEMGLRLALGADPGHVVWLVMKEVLVLLGLGLAVGVPAAVGLGRLVSSQLYGIQPDDPWLAIATMALLGFVSAVAGFIPAHRASRIDPNLALRYE